MREAHYWDLLNSYQFMIIGGFLIAFAVEGYLLRITLKKRKTIFSAILIILVLGTLVFGLFVRTSLLPGGGLYDTFYDMDRVHVSMVQEDLDRYKANCGLFPTTEQGLNALVQLPAGVECPNYKSTMKRAPDFKYASDGKTYEIEATRNYRIQGLFVRGTNEIRSRLYIRE